MQEKIKIVGIGGFPRSGKDALADLFMEAGYFGVSFGDIVRGFAFERHKDKSDPISVANMTETSNWLRETRGADVILHEVLQQFKERQAAGEVYKGVVLWSLRAPVEVDFVLQRGGEMIWVEADDAVRHDRGLRAMRVGEARTTLEEFKRQEALQWKPQPNVSAAVQMDLSYVQSHATRTFVNNGNDLEAFLVEAQKLIQSLV